MERCEFIIIGLKIGIFDSDIIEYFRNSLLFFMNRAPKKLVPKIQNRVMS